MDDFQDSELLRTLRREILFARERVYRVGKPTPLERIDGLGPFSIFVKREDLSPIKAYKWRGAFNRMAVMSAEERARGVVTASAGNHAQGVALAAAHLGMPATIFMPQTTPLVKQRAVRQLGGEAVRVELAGDSYDEAFTAARQSVEAHGGTYVHAYDDLLVMAGQGTLADEIVLSGEGPFDVAYLQIGGGGMAAGVAAWLKTYYPAIRIVGVEGVGQASMKGAVEAGKRVRLEEMDIFCDGTAVRMAGELPFAVCRELIDEFVTVTNGEVSDAIRMFWDHLRCLSEPSGAMGLAGAWRQRAQLTGKKVLVVLCGANIDFNRLGAIAASAGIAERPRHYLRIRIPERSGTMLRLLDDCLGETNIVAFQYGKNHPDDAWPLFGVSATAEELERITGALRERHYSFERVSEEEEVRYRLIPLRGDLLRHPVFLDLEFYERAGALHAFLTRTIRGRASFCYFNYAYSGERVGRALIGLEFQDSGQRESFLTDLPRQGEGYRSCRALPAEITRLLTS